MDPATDSVAQAASSGRASNDTPTTSHQTMIVDPATNSGSQAAGSASGSNDTSTSRHRTIIGRLAPWSVVAGYVLMVGVFAILRPETFISAATLGNLLDQATIPVILACGLTMVVAAGEFDLSFTAVMGLTSGLVVTFLAHQGMAIPLALLLTVVIALVVGTVVGYIVAAGGANSFIVTLALSSVLVGIELGVTGNKAIFENIPNDFKALGRNEFLGLNQPVWLMLLVVAVSVVVLHFTRFGRHIYAVGGNSTAAYLAGVNVRRTIILTFVVVAILAVLAAFVRSTTSGSYFPNASAGYLLNTFAAVFLGAAATRSGRFTVLGSAFGVLWLLTLQTGLTQVNQPAWVSTLVQGAVLAAAVLLAARTKRRGAIA